MFNKSLFFLLVFCNFAFAENFVIPEQKIVGAELPIPLGELVDLSISPIQSSPKFLVSTTYAWKVFDGYTEKRIRNYENGVFFGSGIQAKRLKVIVSITHLYIVKDNEKLLETAIRTNFISTDVFIGEQDPDTPPEPEVEPEFGESKYQLSKFVYDGVKNNIKLSKSDKAKQCAAIATSFDSIAAAIAAGTIATLDDILKKTAESNKLALTRSGGDRTKWEPVFTEIQEKLFDLYKTNKMQTKEDFAIAWREISSGLKLIK
jgi:hypothetical protein